LGQLTSSSFLWFLLCATAVAIVFGVYFLGFRLAWAREDAERLLEQCAMLNRDNTPTGGREENTTRARAGTSGEDADAATIHDKIARLDRMFVALNQMLGDIQERRATQTTVQ
jgi:hypothetical protein